MDKGNLVKLVEVDNDFIICLKRASLECTTTSEEGRKNATYMKEVMEGVGFLAYKNENGGISTM